MGKAGDVVGAMADKVSDVKGDAVDAGTDETRDA